MSKWACFPIPAAHYLPLKRVLRYRRAIPLTAGGREGGVYRVVVDTRLYTFSKRQALQLLDSQSAVQYCMACASKRWCIY